MGASWQGGPELHARDVLAMAETGPSRWGGQMRRAGESLAGWAHAGQTDGGVWRRGTQFRTPG